MHVSNIVKLYSGCYTVSENADAKKVDRILIM